MKKKLKTKYKFFDVIHSQPVQDEKRVVRRNIISSSHETAINRVRKDYFSKDLSIETSIIKHVVINDEHQITVGVNRSASYCHQMYWKEEYIVVEAKDNSAYPIEKYMK